MTVDLLQQRLCARLFLDAQDTDDVGHACGASVDEAVDQRADARRQRVADDVSAGASRIEGDAGAVPGPGDRAGEGAPR